MIDNVGMPKGSEVAPNEGPSGKRFSRFYPGEDFSRKNRSRAIEAAGACRHELAGYQEMVASVASDHVDFDAGLLALLDHLNFSDKVTSQVNSLDPSGLGQILDEIRSIDATSAYGCLDPRDAVLCAFVQWLVASRHFKLALAKTSDAISQNLEAADLQVAVVSKSRRKRRRTEALERMATTWRDSKAREHEVLELEAELALLDLQVLAVSMWAGEHRIGGTSLEDLPRPELLREVLFELSITRALRFIHVHEWDETPQDSNILSLFDPAVLPVNVYRAKSRGRYEAIYHLELEHYAELPAAEHDKLVATGLDWWWSDYKWNLDSSLLRYATLSIIQIVRALELALESEDVRFPSAVPQPADPQELARRIMGPYWDER